MTIHSANQPRERSKAWVYYAIITCLALLASFSQPIALVVAVVAGLYSYYLFQGGRFVVWFW